MSEQVGGDPVRPITPDEVLLVGPGDAEWVGRVNKLLSVPWQPGEFERLLPIEFFNGDPALVVRMCRVFSGAGWLVRPKKRMFFAEIEGMVIERPSRGGVK